MTPANPVKIGPVSIGQGRPLALIAGPCVMEPGDLTMHIANRLFEICTELAVPLIFKASFDKANRTSGSSFRGPGMVEGLKTFERIKAEFPVPVTTDIHETAQAVSLAKVVDLIQVPAFLARQTDLLEAAAGTGRPINVKKGQFMAPWDMANVVAIPQMQATGAPVVFDATHSVQLPSAGAGGTASSGQREMIPTLAKAAVAAGCDALFVEVHPDPDKALSDGPNSLQIDDLPALLRTCLRIRHAIDLP
jgi:2-dehydro-3-deoxyphosphooctonate aldolase (KDO 8-P synthase)